MAYSKSSMGWGDFAQGGVTNVKLDLYPHAMLTEPFVEQLSEALSPLIRKTTDS